MPEVKKSDRLREVLFASPQGLRYKLILTLAILFLPAFLIFTYLMITRYFRIAIPPKDLILLAVLILTISSLGFSVVWRMVRAILGVQQGAGKVSAGNLEHQIDIESDDEIGKLAGSLNKIASRLQETVIAVENEKNKIQTMVKSMADGVLMTDDRDELVLINPVAKQMFRQMSGLKREDKIDKKILESSQGSELANVLKEAIKGGEVTTKEITSEKPKKMTLSAHMSPVKNSRGDKLGVVTVLRDITKLKEIDQMKSDFVSNVSHELRTPLTSIRESIGLILEGITGKVTEKQVKFLRIAKRNTERLTNLINDLLDLARIEAGKIEIKKKSINLVDLAKEIMESFDSQAKEKKISLESSFLSSIPHVYADPDRIAQVLTNLLSNALKFTSEGGKVKVRAKLSSDPEFVEASVQDTGLGITPQDLERVFGRFEKIDSPLPERTPGTGLGLAIVKEIIGLHQGEVWAESKPGEGSTFHFTLPVRRQR
jgi:PAS domain S-box-containing protein